MSDKPAVFQGSYADLRFIKGRKVAAITVEIPIEAAAAFVDVFGAPNPAAEIPVVLARLAADAVKGGLQSVEQARAERRRFSDLPFSQQAALRCNEPEFRRFLASKVLPAGDKAEATEDTAAAIVRNHCGVNSRRELDSNPDAAKRWTMLDAEFFGWQRDPRAA